MIVEWSDSGRGEWEWIAPLHVHHADDEAWYVLEGTLRLRLGDAEIEAGPGSAVSPRAGCRTHTETRAPSSLATSSS